MPLIEAKLTEELYRNHKSDICRIITEEISGAWNKKPGAVRVFVEKVPSEDISAGGRLLQPGEMHNPELFLKINMVSGKSTESKRRLVADLTKQLALCCGMDGKDIRILYCEIPDTDFCSGGTSVHDKLAGQKTL